jgi:hypothetical protein
MQGLVPTAAGKRESLLLCSGGSSSLGYQAFSLLRLWCQRLQVKENLSCMLGLVPTVAGKKESFLYARTGANGCK